jgi:hypothetical protein
MHGLQTVVAGLSFRTIKFKDRVIILFNFELKKGLVGLRRKHQGHGPLPSPKLPFL